jgi:L-malate glycosyltransferase
MIAREFPPVGGGIGYYVYNLSRGLIEKGYTVSVITRGSTQRFQKKVIDGIDVYEATFFPFYPVHLELHKLFVSQLLRSLKPDLIHLHSPVTPSFRLQCPVVTTVHTAMKTDARYHEVVNAHSLAEKMQSRYFSPLAEYQLLKRSDIITTVSPSVAQELEEYRIDPTKVKVVWNGVDEKRFCPSSTSTKTNKKYVLFTGRLWARKGLFDLINSAKIVKSRIPDIKYVICGTGPLLQKLKEQVRNLELESQVQFMGRVSSEKLLDTYQHATIQVVPSIYEGLPTVILEGMSCGLPLIATDIGGNRDIIEHGKNGLLIPPASPTSIADTIVELWTNNDLRKDLGKNARETILKKFTWDTIANNFVTIYNQALTEDVEKQKIQRRTIP